MLRLFLRLILPKRKTEREAEAELLVLRHQLKILQRHIPRAPLRRRDRVFLAALSRTLPKVR